MIRYFCDVCGAEMSEGRPFFVKTPDVNVIDELGAFEACERCLPMTPHPSDIFLVAITHRETEGND